VTTSTALLRKRFNGPMQAMGGFFKMCVLTAKALARPFEWKEFTTFSWFLMTVSLLPTFAMSIPLTVLIIFIFNLPITSTNVNVNIPQTHECQNKRSIHNNVHGRIRLFEYDTSTTTTTY
jgi:ABC-type transporter Mla maintaining outer membrane lipid asymmetry permease subunit MlaE